MGNTSKRYTEAQSISILKEAEGRRRKGRRGDPPARRDAAHELPLEVEVRRHGRERAASA